MSYNKVKNVSFKKNFTKFTVNSSCSNDTSGYSVSNEIDIKDLFYCFDSRDLQVKIKEEKACLVENLIFGKFNIYKGRKYGYYEIYGMMNYKNTNREKDFMEKFNISENELIQIKTEFEQLNKDFLKDLIFQLKALRKNKDLYRIKYGNYYISKFKREYNSFWYNSYQYSGQKFTKNIALHIIKNSSHDLTLEKVEKES